MHKILKSTAFVTVLLIPVVLMLVSCLDTGNTDFPSSTQINYSISGINSNVIRSDDTLRVLNARFVLNNIQLNTTNSQEILVNEKRTLLYSIANNNRPINVTNKEIAGAGYTGLQLDFETPDPDDDINNPNASILINGVYNGSLFEYSSSFTFSRSFNFDSTLVIKENNENISILIEGNASRWFIDATDNTILSPFNVNNNDKINGNVSTSFSIITDVFHDF